LNRATINEEISIFQDEDLLDSDDWLGLHYDSNFDWYYEDGVDTSTVDDFDDYGLFDDYGYSICRWMLDEELVVINDDRLVITSQGRTVLHGLGMINLFYN
jgi:hypothetical protein